MSLFCYRSHALMKGKEKAKICVSSIGNSAWRVSPVLPDPPEQNEVLRPLAGASWGLWKRLQQLLIFPYRSELVSSGTRRQEAWTCLYSILTTCSDNGNLHHWQLNTRLESSLTTHATELKVECGRHPSRLHVKEEGGQDRVWAWLQAAEWWPKGASWGLLYEDRLHLFCHGCPTMVWTGWQSSSFFPSRFPSNRADSDRALNPAYFLPLRTRT